MAFLLYLILIMLIISIAIITSKVQVEIEEFKYKNITEKNIFTRQEKRDKQINFLIKFKMCIFYKIPVILISFDENKLKKLKTKKSFEKIENKLKKQMDKLQIEFIQNFIKTRDAKAILNILTIVKELNMKFKKVDLKINIGLEDVILTSLLVPAISTIVALLLKETKIELKGNKYEVNPIYNLQNFGKVINISLKCIIEAKMIHIINIMYIIKNQRKVNNNVRTSNRRSYDYSYE